MTKNQTLPCTPNLECLPDWANGIAQDADGAWWAYEAHPNQQEQGWYENEVGRIALLGKTAPPTDCQTTLRRVRP